MFINSYSFQEYFIGERKLSNLEINSYSLQAYFTREKNLVYLFIHFYSFQKYSTRERKLFYLYIHFFSSNKYITREKCCFTYDFLFILGILHRREEVILFGDPRHPLEQLRTQLKTFFQHYFVNNFQIGYKNIRKETINSFLQIRKVKSFLQQVVLKKKT